MRRATSAHSIASFSLVFLSTLSLRRATGCGRSGHTATQISIHALLAESDNKQVLHIEPPKLFLSTLSLRRATVRGSASFVVLYHFYPRSPCGERLLSGLRFSRLRDFYPRSPCGERPQIFYRVGIAINISIHALLAESDDRYAVAAVSDEIISIHALLAESDHAFAFALKTSDYFYPRSPCGERQRPV